MLKRIIEERSGLAFRQRGEDSSLQKVFYYQELDHTNGSTGGNFYEGYYTVDIEKPPNGVILKEEQMMAREAKS